MGVSGQHPSRAVRATVDTKLRRRRGLAMLAALAPLAIAESLVPAATARAAVVRTMTSGTGSWSVASNWSPRGTPADGDDVVLRVPSTMDLPNSVVGNLSVQTGSLLYAMTGGSGKLPVTVSGNIIVAR